ncbi:hypothetical protein [Wenyingzhuangia aestuarii]|uniref:hypothetical protein n=1 Tax=Wenyingzhuangia aestuarii TaxID=1647582 RepID=UPI00143C938A|nr:hypothetical protein [Wenyingzhuangia aestuarii]NJB82760.1 hypothetical protein [Wenyingzhuangia aestuarii]
MNLKSILLGISLIVSTSVFSQKWIDNQVNKEVEKTNNMLAETDKALVLTEEQEKTLRTLNREFFLLRDEKAKTIKNKNELWKSLSPELKVKNQKIKEILSTEQNKALRTAWAKKNKK